MTLLALGLHFTPQYLLCRGSCFPAGLQNAALKNTNILILVPFENHECLYFPMFRGRRTVVKLSALLVTAWRIELAVRSQPRCLSAQPVVTQSLAGRKLGPLSGAKMAVQLHTGLKAFEMISPPLSVSVSVCSRGSW